MKTINECLLPGLITGLVLIGVDRSTAQTLTIAPLHSFNISDHSNPYGGLILSGDTLYGTTEGDEFDGSGIGTVFRIKTDGTGFTNLHTFVGSDGASPYGGMILASNTLYGASNKGGNWGHGTVFKVNTDGTGFESLHNFAGDADGDAPATGLTLSGNTLYGTTFLGGDSNSGTLFAVSTDGVGFRVVHSFTALAGALGVSGINSDGANPRSGLILSGNTLYGATADGGSSGYGAVFRVDTDGSAFTNLRSFTGTGFADITVPNGEGWFPRSGLVLAGNRLYGMAQYGGTGAAGSVFAVSTDGTGFTNLHSFMAGAGPFPNTTNSDGAYPRAGLILSGNTLYGAAAWGGRLGFGTLF